MKFVKDGPEIPESLLQLHEEGNVVFFCGAGVSYPAGLPTFKDLALQLYERAGVTPSPIQQAAIKKLQYDTAIGLLESVHQGGRKAVREELNAILTPVSLTAKSTRTHQALLMLSRSRKGRLRMITTNFDRLFERALDTSPINRFAAPFLPIPKSQWDGIVYLHGLLAENPSESNLDSLVVSSGDFGLAYLTERWAARFVGELFRQYTVCFVGYSLNDPVLRYMMDAIAADRLRGESSLDIYSFCGHKRGRESEAEAEWRSRNVIPILYLEEKDHRLLHRTIQQWAETYRDGVRGKEMIVLQEAGVSPRLLTKQDDVVDRVLWALSDSTGSPARRFADMNPVPSLDWLEALEVPRFGHVDLKRFGVFPNVEPNEHLKFSMTRRPSPYLLGGWMMLSQGGSVQALLDPVMSHLARWLTRHLDDPALLLWLDKQGGNLNSEFSALIERRIHEIIDLETKGDDEKLGEIRAASPSGIPRKSLRVFWRLLLSGAMAVSGDSLEFYRWLESFKREGLNSTSRAELRSLLSPRVSLRKPFRWPDGVDQEGKAENLRDLLQWELDVGPDHFLTYVRELETMPEWVDVLPLLLQDLESALRDLQELAHEIYGGGEYAENSHFDQPSISDHPQNQYFRSWTGLLLLVRNSWTALAKVSPSDGFRVAQNWIQSPYPLFKRLALFAITVEGIVPTAPALDWILSDDNWWLWSTETKREILRAFESVLSKLSKDEQERLEVAILTGPPRSMFWSDSQEAELTRTIDDMIRLRLARVHASGLQLGAQAIARLGSLSKQSLDIPFVVDERDEFSTWFGNGEDWGQVVLTPRSRPELVLWLEKYPAAGRRTEDDWSNRCRSEVNLTAFCLYKLTQRKVWLAERWREALQAWSDDSVAKRSWECVATVLGGAPQEEIRKLAKPLAWWLKSVAKTIQVHREVFVALCSEVLQLDFSDQAPSNEPLAHAINHPVGHVTQAILSYWHTQEPEDGQGLPDDIQPIFDKISDKSISKLRPGRVLLASNLVTLFRVDPVWTKSRLVSNFDWADSEIEAQSAWEGFLWSPRLFPPLLELLKVGFLKTAEHFEEMRDLGNQYVRLLTSISLDSRGIFAAKELRPVFERLPEKGKLEAVNLLVRMLEGAGDQRTEYWNHRIGPFWKSTWPKQKVYMAPLFAEPVAKLCLLAGEAFQAALETLHPWLLPVDHVDFITGQLADLPALAKFPAECLDFLGLIVGEAPRWAPRRLKDCLDEIGSQDPALRDTFQFRRLLELVRRLT